VIRVCTSHRTEVLLEAFVARLVEERMRTGPLAQVQVVVPNRNVETYLRLKVAEHCGIAANLETTFLRRFLTGIVERALPDARVADAAYVEGHLLALLHDDTLLAAPSLAHVRAYLAAAATDNDALDRRRCQLAVALAQLFEEYAGSRPEMLVAWAGDAANAAAEPDHLEVWQQALWRAVFGPDGRLARQASATGLRYLALDALWNEAMAKKPAPFAGKILHVFGLSYIATTYHRMLASLARESAIYIYTLNPCREAESELLAKPDLSTDDPYGLARDPHVALGRWARPGRENLRLLAACPGATVEARFPACTGATLLRRLQSDIVERRGPEPVVAHSAPDNSLRVLPCPSLRRELEVVAAEIWNLVRRDPSLRLCDVAVIVPEASKDLYLAQLSAVFGESCALPHNVADLSAANAHRVTEAIELLLRLPFSTFTRKDLLPLVTHPCLMARFPKATPESWRELAHELGIVRGADSSDFAGSYITRDLFTWDQGLRRLALGALLDGGNQDDVEPLVVAGEPTLPGPPLDSDDERLGFGLLVRALLSDARFAAGDVPKRPLGDWLDFIHSMVESYLVIDEADRAGRAVVANFLAQIENLRDIGLGDCPVSFRIAAELAKRALAGMPWSHGHYLASGVTVASFVPMRAIPFRAVFVLGLGQEAFPRPAGRHELDLRGGRRKVGDVDRREQDLYMFLETLLSARDYVGLSYVARDEITGDELPCSSVLLELRTLLQGALDPAQLALLFCDEVKTRPPLRRYDDIAQRREVLPAAETEHRAKDLGERLAKGEPLPALPRAVTPPAAGKSETRGPLVIPISALRRFLEDPLQGSARFRLGMVEDDEGAPADIEDEPFDMDRRGLSSLVRASMTDAILAAQAVPTWPDLLAAYERRASRAELAGQCPTGLFRAAGAQGEKDLMRAWHQELPSVLGQKCAACQVFRPRPLADQGLVRSTKAGVVYCPAPSFAVAVPGAADSASLDIRIEGQSGFCASLAEAGYTTLCFTCRQGTWGAGAVREDLGAFLDYVVLTAAGAEPAGLGHRNAIFHTKDGPSKVRVLGFRPLDRTRANDYLLRLCTDLVTGALDENGAATGVHPYLLPHEAVLASRHKQTPLFDEIDKLCAEDENGRSSFSSLQGPVPRVVDRYAPPSPEKAQRMVEDRFSLFFELVVEEDA
jgi:exodeoxyribonuclease V gamma subunit